MIRRFLSPTVFSFLIIAEYHQLAFKMNCMTNSRLPWPPEQTANTPAQKISILGVDPSRMISLPETLLLVLPSSIFRCSSLFGRVSAVNFKASQTQIRIAFLMSNCMLFFPARGIAQLLVDRAIRKFILALRLFFLI